MGAEVRAFDHAHLPGEPATRPIAGLPRRPAAWLLLADPRPAPIPRDLNGGKAGFGYILA